jgi:hypothetical protein
MSSWEYIGSGSNDWWHPKLDRSQANAIMDMNQAGSYCMYGRDPVVLCVKQLNNIICHEPLEFIALHGFRLPCDPNERWHADLTSLVEYYRVRRDGVPFVLADDDHNEVHFNLPDPTTPRTTSGEALGVDLPLYDDQDLERLDRRVSVSLNQACLPPTEDETVPMDVFSYRYERKPSVRTQESIDNFEPVLLHNVVEGELLTSNLQLVDL